MKKESKVSAASLRPLHDRVLVKREDTEEKKTSAGIYIPETAEKEKSKRGVVIAVGPGKLTDSGELVPVTVKPGSGVYFNAGWDNEVKFEGDEAAYFLVHESDILGVIE